MKLTRRHIHALRALAKAPGLLNQTAIPDGNGHLSAPAKHCGTGKYASVLTMMELRHAGLARLIPVGGYVITPAGREALRNSTAAGGPDND